MLFTVVLFVTVFVVVTVGVGTREVLVLPITTVWTGKVVIDTTELVTILITVCVVPGGVNVLLIVIEARLVSVTVDLANVVVCVIVLVPLDVLR